MEGETERQERWAKAAAMFRQIHRAEKGRAYVGREPYKRDCTGRDLAPMVLRVMSYDGDASRVARRRVPTVAMTSADVGIEPDARP